MSTRLMLVTTLVAHAALAQVCSQDQLNQDLQTFRRWSLDLRGRAPSPAELDALVARGGLAGNELEALLASREFKNVLRERLRADVYAALDGSFQNGFSVMRTTAMPFGDSKDVFWNVRRNPRGGAFRMCDVNREQTQFTAQGVPIPDGAGLEGWVRVSPYWAPTTSIKVCAFDAQPHLVGPTSGVDCSKVEATWTNDCGCGPNLRFCQLEVGYATADLDPMGNHVAYGVRMRTQLYEPTEDALNRSFVEQTLRFVDRIVDEGRPWSDVLLSDETELNGPIAHYLREQTRTALDSNLSARPDLGFTVPSTLAQTDRTTWVKVRSTGKAAGVLTQPLFLIKFATNRARANRFYNAFLCSAFQAPPGGLPSSTEPCAQEPNLTRRCGCDSCHQTLEPMAAHWGRFAERGLHELTLPEFPTMDPRCAADAGVSDPHCATYYVTRARTASEQPYVGKLKAYLYADGFEQNIDLGPRALAQQHVQNGDFARCTAKKEFERLVGRPVQEQLADERLMLDALAAEFMGSNHDMRTLVRRIMTSPQYLTVGGVP